MQPEDITVEEWRPVTAPWGDLYEVSSYGRVRSLDRVDPNSRGHIRRYRGRVLKQPTVGGYHRVTLCRSGMSRIEYVHALVCGAFHGPRPGTTREVVCAHWDGDTHNNHPENLRWTTFSENNGADRRRHGTMPRGVEHHMTTLNEAQVIEIFNAKGMHKEIAARYGVQRGCVGKIKRRDTWRHVTRDL